MGSEMCIRDRSKMADGPPQKLNLQQLLQQFRPFNVPPPPVPFASEADRERQATAKAQPALHYLDNSVKRVQSVSKSSRRMSYSRAVSSYRASNTLAVSVTDRQAHEEGSSTPLSLSASWLLRRSRRQLAVTRRHPTMFLISVKRQRKLKMKKHKYKKLMRRTRNLRRREGRT